MDSSKSSVKLSWKKPTYDGGSQITGYKLQYALTDSEEFQTAAPVFTSNEECTIDGLTTDQQYR